LSFIADCFQLKYTYSWCDLKIGWRKRPWSSAWILWQLLMRRGSG